MCSPICRIGLPGVALCDSGRNSHCFKTAAYSAWRVLSVAIWEGCSKRLFVAIMEIRLQAAREGVKQDGKGKETVVGLWEGVDRVAMANAVSYPSFCQPPHLFLLPGLA